MAKKSIQSILTIPAGSIKTIAPTLGANGKPIAPPKPVNSPVVKPFGVESGVIDQYPNDVVILDIYNAVNVYLETNYRVSTFIKKGNEMELNVEEDVKKLGYISGKFITEYKFHRNYLGSGDGHKVQIQEISSDGLEARITAIPNSAFDNTNYLDFFSTKLFNLPKAQTLSDLFLIKKGTKGAESYRVFDYIQDRFTLPLIPYSIVLKFTSPLPTTVSIGDEVWIAQQLSEPITDTIVMVPPKPKRNQTIISGPNWDVLNKLQTTVTTPYKDWDDILTTNTQTTEGIINSLLSGSLIEGINLNVDYRKFDNHIVLGSAVERLENFKYKMRLLEDYNSRLALLTTNLIGSPSSGVSASLAFQTNVINTKTKKAALLGSFDSYEKYLYNQSSSYESSSYGEFYPSTWPKSGSQKPYVNWSVTSSQVEDWYDGIYSSASLYDNNNDKALYKLTPAHVLEDASNDQYSLFVNMMGHYFDIMLLYIKQISETTDRKQSIYEGFSKDLIYHVAKNLGVDFENGNVLEELWAYTLGTNSTGSLSSQYDATSSDRTNEIWKRIINNLPYLLKTKGTERGVRALINCYGIPQTILRIREYGGAEPEFDTKTDLQYERFNYAHKILSVYDSSFTASYGLVPEPYQLEWAPTTTLHNGLKPMAIQLRVKFAKNQTSRQWIFGTEDVFNSEVYNAGPSGAENWKVEAFYSASNSYIGFFLKGTQGWATASVSSSIYDGTFHSITLQRSVASDVITTNQTYTLIAKKVNYDKVVSTQTASLFIDGATSSSYNKSFVSGSNSSLFFGATSASFTGTSSMQEFRLWTTPLDDNILDNHALAPTSFQGNTDRVSTGSTSSYSDLAFRLCLGSDNKRPEYPSLLASQHPNQNQLKFGNGNDKSVMNFGVVNYIPAANASLLWEPIIEKHSLEWPDLGGNRSIGTKIRIESTTTAGTAELWTDNKSQRSLSDTQPPDSSRLGVYFSPQNEINQDIAEQFGGISIDDYIGDPSYLSLDTYPGLDRLKWEYSRKFTSGRNNSQNYIRLLRYYDASLFQLIKKFVPYRANTQTGLVIEPTIIERAKVRMTVPSYELLHYSSSIDIGPDAIWTPGGAIQDGDGEPFRDQPGTFNNGYVPEGKIGGDEGDYIRLSGEEQRVSEYNDVINYPTYDYQAPRQNIDMIPDFNSPEVDYIVIDGTDILLSPTFDESYANQFNRLGLDDNPSTSGSMTAEVDLGISQYGRDTRVLGSQYTFTTWAVSGSGSTHSAPYLISSSHYAYSEALSPTILTARYSEIINDNSDIYGLNVFANKAFTGSYALETGSTIFTASYAFQNNLWTSQYGLRISSSFTSSNSPGYGSGIYGTAVYGATLTSSTSPYGAGVLIISPTGSEHWRMNNTKGLHYYSTAVRQKYSGSAAIQAFYYESDQKQTQEYLYDVNITLNASQSTGSIVLFYGSFDSQYTQEITIPATPTTYTYRTKADGNWLGMLMKVSASTAAGALEIQNLSVKSVNYRAEVQDFHLRDSYGMRNARYDGCKMTSTDYNVDSTDTIDGGPVITITTGNGVELVSSPNPRGNFQIR